MATNPTRALEALTASGEDVGGVHVREITLGVSAVLERIGSPLVTGRAPETLLDMLPTMFAMTRPAAESQRLLASGGTDALRDAAVEWADGFGTEQGMEISRACVRALLRVSRVSPQGVPDKEGAPAGNGSAAVTAGSSESPRSARSATAGHGPRSGTARRSRPSC